jgi:hypothetical protein
MNISKQRVFSHTENRNYNDYLKNKNGIAMLKELKYHQPCHIIHSFGNYRTFFTLSQTYYHYVTLDNACNTYATQNMYESNISYKIPEENCNCPMVEEKDYCNNNILYPYGKYIGNNMCNEHFPSNLDLNKWCSNNNKHRPICLIQPRKKESKIQLESKKINLESDSDSDSDSDSSTNAKINTNPKQNLKKFCKTGLCKKGKEIFV